MASCLGDGMAGPSKGGGRMHGLSVGIKMMSSRGQPLGNRLWLTTNHGRTAMHGTFR